MLRWGCCVNFHISQLIFRSFSPLFLEHFHVYLTSIRTQNTSTLILVFKIHIQKVGNISKRLERTALMGLYFCVHEDPMVVCRQTCCSFSLIWTGIKQKKNLSFVVFLGFGSLRFSPLTNWGLQTKTKKIRKSFGYCSLINLSSSPQRLKTERKTTNLIQVYVAVIKHCGLVCALWYNSPLQCLSVENIQRGTAEN